MARKKRSKKNDSSQSSKKCSKLTLSEVSTSAGPSQLNSKKTKLSYGAFSSNVSGDNAAGTQALSRNSAFMTSNMPGSNPCDGVRKLIPELQHAGSNPVMAYGASNLFTGNAAAVSSAAYVQNNVNVSVAGLMSGCSLTPAQAQYNYNLSSQVQYAMQAQSMQAAYANQQNMYMHMHQQPMLPSVMYGSNVPQAGWMSPRPGSMLYPQQTMMSAGMFGNPQAGFGTMPSGFAPLQQQVGLQPTGVMFDHRTGSQATSREAFLSFQQADRSTPMLDSIVSASTPVSVFKSVTDGGKEFGGISDSDTDPGSMEGSGVDEDELGKQPSSENAVELTGHKKKPNHDFSQLARQADERKPPAKVKTAPYANVSRPKSEVVWPEILYTTEEFFMHWPPPPISWLSLPKTVNKVHEEGVLASARLCKYYYGSLARDCTWESCKYGHDPFEFNALQYALIQGRDAWTRVLRGHDRRAGDFPTRGQWRAALEELLARSRAAKTSGVLYLSEYAGANWSADAKAPPKTPAVLAKEALDDRMGSYDAGWGGFQSSKATRSQKQRSYKSGLTDPDW